MARGRSFSRTRGGRTLWPRKMDLTTDKGRLTAGPGAPRPHAQRFSGLRPSNPSGCWSGPRPKCKLMAAALGLVPFHLEREHSALGQLCLSLSDCSVLGKLLC